MSSRSRQSRGPEIMIAVAEAKAALEATTGDLATKVKTAMRVTCRHWLVIEETDRFFAAVLASMAHYGAGSAEYARLKAELDDLKRFNAALCAAEAGVPVDFASLAAQERDYESIGLVELWKETMKGEEARQKMAGAGPALDSRNNRRTRHG